MSNWIKVINGATESNPLGITVDAAGMIYVSGESTVDNDNQFFVAKYDTAGTLQWDKALGDNSTTVDEGSGSLAVDTSGNVYAQFQYDGSFMIVKLSSSGVDQWWRQIANWEGSNNAASDFATGIILDSSGDAYVTGYTSGDSYLVKYNSSGVFQWNREIRSGAETNPQSRLLDITVYNDEVYVTGYNDTWKGALGAGTFDLNVVKFTTAGSATAWAALRYDSSRTQTLDGDRISRDSSGNIFVADLSRKEIHRFTSAGSYSWTRVIAGGSLSVFDIECQGTDVYVLAVDSGDIIVLKIDSAGDLVYEREIDHSTLSISARRITTDQDFLYIWAVIDGDFLLAKLDIDLGYTGTQGSFTISDPATYSLTTTSYTTGQHPTVATTVNPNAEATDRTAADITTSETTTSFPVTHQAVALLTTTATVAATGSRLVQNWEPYDWDSLSTWDSWPYDDWDRPNWRPETSAVIFADGLIVVPGEASLASTTDFTAQGGLLIGGSTAATAESTLSAGSSMSFAGSLAVSSEFTSDFSARLGFNTSIFADSFAGLSVDASLAKIGSADLATDCQLSALAGLALPGSAALETTAAITGALVRLVEGTSDLSSTFTVSASAVIVILGSIEVNSTTEVTATASLGKTGECDLQGFAAVLAVGEIANLQQFVYIIEQETRQFKVKPELREYEIAQETRTYKI